MKILQINSVCGRGSTGRIVMQIHRELIKNAHQSYTAYSRSTAVNCSEDNREILKIGGNALCASLSI
ncbi:MAG: hypothetical protein ABIM18_06790 [candidate division WOR-3 bacterium]